MRCPARSIFDMQIGISTYRIENKFEIVMMIGVHDYGAQNAAVEKMLEHESRKTNIVVFGFSDNGNIGFSSEDILKTVCDCNLDNIIKVSLLGKPERRAKTLEALRDGMRHFEFR